MTEDIVERMRELVGYSTLRGGGYSPDKLTILEGIATIESLRAQLSTEHALGFKAGIEAGAAIAQRCMDDEDEKAAADRSDDIEVFGKRLMAFGTAQVIRDEITSLPTPPSPLPEILEAMRPFAVTDTAWNGEPDSLVIELRGVDDEPQPCVHLGDIRRLVAVVTKLGGTHD